MTKAERKLLLNVAKLIDNTMWGTSTEKVFLQADIRAVEFEQQE